MKIITVSKTKLISSLLLSFVLGVMVSQTVLRHIKKEKIPQGTWISLYAGERISVQLNTTLLKTDGAQLTTWLREDRNEKFDTVYGIEGETILSKVTIDCDSLLITMHEQHGYSRTMSLIKSVQVNSNMATPEGVAEIVSIITVCQIPIDDLKMENNNMSIKNKKPNLTI